MRTYFKLVICNILALALLITVAPLARAAVVGTTFATPQEAAQALVTAAGARDRAAVRTLFGLNGSCEKDRLPSHE